MTLPAPQPDLGSEVPLTDLEQYFISVQPKRLWPVNQNSNLGLLRLVLMGELEAAMQLLDELANETFIDTASGYLSLWETELGLPKGQGGRSDLARRAALLARREIGAFTRTRREELVKRYIEETFGGSAPAFSALGISIGSGITLLSDSPPGGLAYAYNIIEDIEDFSYLVRIVNTVAPDLDSLERELDHITPAHISFSVDNTVDDPWMDETGTLTKHGDIIDDVMRDASVTTWDDATDGGSTEIYWDNSPLYLPFGWGLFKGRTNLFRDAQPSATTDWVANAAGVTLSVDATRPGRFSTDGSIKVVPDGSVANQGVYAKTNTGLALAAGTKVQAHIWLYGNATATMRAAIDIVNTDASVTSGTFNTITVSAGRWTLIKATANTVAVGKTGDQIRLKIYKNTSGFTTTFWAAHAMIEAPAEDISPYIATATGVQSMAAAYIDLPTNLMDETKGWIVASILHGYNHATPLEAATNPVLFDWRDDANNYLKIYYDYAAVAFVLARKAGGTEDTISVSTNVGRDSNNILLFKWDATHLYGGRDGNPVTSVAATHIPTLAASSATIGRSAAGASGYLNSTLRAFAYGSGDISDADWVTLDEAISANTRPYVPDFGDDAEVKLILPCGASGNGYFEAL